jgi:hypothetical protein
MIFKLPIIIENKIVYTLFRLIKNDNNFILTILPNNYINNDEVDCDFLQSENKIDSKMKKPNNTLIQILVCNNINGYELINIYLPLKIFIINNHLITIYFFSINILSTFQNKLDFFANLNLFLFNKYKMKFITNNNYIKYKNNILDFINNQYINLLNNKKYNKEFWEIVNLLLNSSGYYLWIEEQEISETKIKLTKKIISTAKNLKNIKFKIEFSNSYTILEHLNKMNNNILKLSEIIKDSYYYILIENRKILLVKVININNNMIQLEHFSELIDYNKFKWYNYPPESKINKNKIFFNLLTNHESIKSIILKYNSKLDNISIDNIINYFVGNQVKSNLNSFILENNLNDSEKTDLEIIKSDSYSNEYFKVICDKYSSNFNIILDALLSNYVYPIKYNKKELSNNFDNIIYISLMNIDKILSITDKEKIFINGVINIPQKLKSLYFNIIKTFYLLINKISVKYFADPTHLQLMKIILSSTSLTYNLLVEKISLEEVNNFKNIILNYCTLIDIINRLNWNNINKRLHYLKILLNHKEYLYFYDKLNKNLFPENFDTRIKLIINNPLEMFKFIKKENDFIKWIYFLGNKCSDLYIVPMSLSSDDFNILGKIMYYFINIKEQTMNDKYYNKLIAYGNKYPKLILDNNRINLKLKENFGHIKCNINLGILAKHLSQNKDNIIEFPDENNEVQILKNEIIKITNKYLKYKNKYIKSKKK